MLRQEVPLWQQAISEAIARADLAADAMAQPAWQAVGPALGGSTASSSSTAGDGTPATAAGSAAAPPALLLESFRAACMFAYRAETITVTQHLYSTSAQEVVQQALAAGAPEGHGGLVLHDAAAAGPPPAPAATLEIALAKHFRLGICIET